MKFCLKYNIVKRLLVQILLPMAIVWPVKQCLKPIHGWNQVIQVSTWNALQEFLMQSVPKVTMIQEMLSNVQVLIVVLMLKLFAVIKIFLYL